MYIVTDITFTNDVHVSDCKINKRMHGGGNLHVPPEGTLSELRVLVERDPRIPTTSTEAGSGS